MSDHINNLSSEELDIQLHSYKKMLDWENTTESTKKWWEAMESKWSERKYLLVHLAKELAEKEVTITEFFLAYVYTSTDSVREVLEHLDKIKVKKEDYKTH